MKLFEDSEGIMWVGTEDGLNRFDKYTETFKCYKHNPDDTSSINWGIITDIVEDREMNLWITSYSGFSRYDRKTETFRNYAIAREDGSVFQGPHDVYGLYPDGEGYLWLTSDDGVYRFNTASGSIEKIVNPFFTWNIYEDISGRLWFISDHGLYLYNRKNQSYERYLNEPENPNRLNNENIRAMHEDESGNIWIRTLDGIYCYNQALELIFHRRHSFLYPYSYDIQRLTKEIFMDNTGSIWFYTREGINTIIKKERNIRVYDSDTTLTYWVNCIFVENNDIIWYGTMRGISSFDRRKNTSVLHYGDPLFYSGFPHSARSMCMDREGTLWVGMDFEGLFSVDSTALRKLNLYSINHIFEDSQGRLWIGTESNVWLNYYDKHSNQLIHLVDNPSAKDRLPRGAQIRHETGSNDLWAMGSAGVFKIVPPLIKVSDTEMMASDVIKCQTVNNDGISMDISSVRVSFIDSTAHIWLGTFHHGLLKLTEQNLPGNTELKFQIKSFTTSQGLPGNQVQSILPDGMGNLWLGTDNGLSKLNMQSETFTNYYIRHGLPVNEFRPESAAIGEDGEMFFGTIRGMISFYPDSIFINQYVAPVILTDLKIHNQTIHPGENSVLQKSICYTDKIELRHHQNNVSFEFAILNYLDTELNQYKYKLVGFNDDWVYAGNRTGVDFTNLRPGHYTFMVTGSNNDGIWNEEGASLDMVIHPPPWQTWWAYLIYVFILISIFLMYRSYLLSRERLLREIELERIGKEKAQELDQLKSRFFANISHEFRTPLTLIRGPLDELDKIKSGTITLSRPLLSVLRRNTQRLQRLINQLLDLSKLETGKIILLVSEGNLTEFVRTISLSFLSLAESKKIKYTFDLTETTRPVFFDSDKMEKILTNLISNALKFTPPGGEVSVSLLYVSSGESDVIQFADLRISDTGKGIPPELLDRIFDRFYQVSDSVTREEEGTGIGLALARELVDLYRGELRVESEVGRGSTFRVRLPVSKEQFKNEEIVDPGEEISAEAVESDIDLEESGFAEMEDSHDLEKSKRGPVILIVEDNVDLRNYISGNLGGSYQILKAENGKQGLERAIEYIPDLVISDVMMPEMDGMEMCRLLKQDQRTNHIPLIMLTARADRVSKMEGLETGADDYLIKPFDAEELQVRVKNLVDQRNALREKYRREFITEPDGHDFISQDDQLLHKILNILNEHLPEPEFNIDLMSDQLNMSRTQMYRKVYAVTGHTPKDLLRAIRLKKAASLFDAGEDNISQVMYQIGFNNHSYFAKCFRKLYKLNPSEYLKARIR
ncbi:MAG: ATP-binding protein [Bacteroidota bacterium]